MTYDFHSLLLIFFPFWSTIINKKKIEKKNNSLILMVGCDVHPTYLVPSSGMLLHEVPHDLVVHVASGKVLERCPMSVVAGACHKLISS